LRLRRSKSFETAEFALGLCVKQNNGLVTEPTRQEPAIWGERHARALVGGAPEAANEFAGAEFPQEERLGTGDTRGQPLAVG
jgi:hypothetical protein